MHDGGVLSWVVIHSVMEAPPDAWRVRDTVALWREGARGRGCVA
jgi:hypothetical protein